MVWRFAWDDSNDLQQESLPFPGQSSEIIHDFEIAGASLWHLLEWVWWASRHVHGQCIWELWWYTYFFPRSATLEGSICAKLKLVSIHHPFTELRSRSNTWNACCRKRVKVVKWTPAPEQLHHMFHRGAPQEVPWAMTNNNQNMSWDGRCFHGNMQQLSAYISRTLTCDITWPFLSIFSNDMSWHVTMLRERSPLGLEGHVNHVGHNPIIQLLLAGSLVLRYHRSGKKLRIRGKTDRIEIQHRHLPWKVGFSLQQWYSMQVHWE